MSFYGIGNDTNSFFNSYFGTNKTSSSSSVLGDWSLIKTGSYKKLLTAYYKNENDAKTSATDTEIKDTTKKFGVISNDAEQFVKSLDKFSSGVKEASAKYATASDEDKEKIMNKLYESASKYVEAYNKAIDSTTETDNTAILRRELNITRNTSANKKMLGKLGIEIGSDNKLTIDESKFKEARISDMSTLFNGQSSYASHVRSNATQMFNVAKAEFATSSNACSYTYKGEYSKLLSGVSSYGDMF